MPRKKSRMFSAFVLTCDRLSTWPAASKTTITVIDLWTSMPTYLILLIGRLLAIGNLDFRNLRLLLAGRPFTLRADALPPKGHKQAAHPACRHRACASLLVRLAQQFIHRNTQRPPHRRRQPRRNVACL